MRCSGSSEENRATETNMAGTPGHAAFRDEKNKKKEADLREAASFFVSGIGDAGNQYHYQPYSRYTL
jgi:hypothetical protein